MNHKGSKKLSALATFRFSSTIKHSEGRSPKSDPSADG